MLWTRIFILLVGCTLATIYDCRRQTIPNWITYTMFLVGMGIAIAHPHTSPETRITKILSGEQLWRLPQNGWDAALGASICWTWLAAGRYFTYLGVGDIKLVTAIGTLLGAVHVMMVLAIALLLALISIRLFQGIPVYYQQSLHDRRMVECREVSILQPCVAMSGFLGLATLTVVALVIHFN